MAGLIHFQNPDGKTQSPVSAAQPLPVTDVSTLSSLAPGAAPAYATAMAGLYEAMPSSMIDHQTAAISIGPRRQLLATMVDANGAILDATAPVQVFRSASYANVTSKTTTAVKAGPGRLVRVVVNKAGSADTVALYDNTAGSGPLIGTLTAAPVGSYAYDAAFATGLTVVTGGTTAGDYTLVYA